MSIVTILSILVSSMIVYAATADLHKYRRSILRTRWGC